MTTSVLIPSWRRVAHLERCLLSLARQNTFPTEAIVVWQAEDTETREAAERLAGALPFPLKALHAEKKGIVAAENAALAAASGEIILLIDDDAEAPTDWIERHVRWYANPAIGAVGGPADNYGLDGAPFPRRSAGPVGKLTWFGRLHGNMYDHVHTWRSLQATKVDHLVGFNMSLRRTAFAQFEAEMLPYWQMFEAEACLQVARRGLEVLFDYSNVVKHHPSNTAYAGGRDGDLTVKVFHSAYNHALLLAKHMPWYLRPWQLGYLLLVGSINVPGVLGCLAAIVRYGRPVREIRILAVTCRHTLRGWSKGRQLARRQR